MGRKTVSWAGVIVAVLMAGCAQQEQQSAASRYHEAYSKPLISPGAKFAKLPPAVQHTIRAEAGAADIQDIQKRNGNGRDVYEVSFANPDLLPPMYIASDGTLLNPDLSVAVGAPQDLVEAIVGEPVAGLKLGDLPPAVAKRIQQLAPDAEILHITKRTQADRPLYIVEFKGRKHPTLYLAGDGTEVHTGR